MQIFLKRCHSRRFLLFAFLSFSFAARMEAQHIRVSVERTNLESIFQLLEQQSGYRFIYTSEAIALAKPVTLQVNKEPFEKVLQLLFASQPLDYTINTSNHHVIVRVKEMPAKNSGVQRLQGSVSYETGEPVAGATIRIMQTGQQTASDSKGSFAFLDAPASGTLHVSGAEWENTTVPYNVNAVIRVVLKPRFTVLDETIVIGYGKTTRRYATESVSKVKGEELTRQPISNPILALGGAVSGLQIIQPSGVPGSAIQVRLRGRNSMISGNDPLYIIDGVPFPSSAFSGNIGGGGSTASSPLDYINPASIESIEILKDASATAIYGSRGANGVILITTKKGASAEPRIQVTSYAGWGRPTTKLDLLETPAYLVMRREAFANDGITPTAGNAPDLLRWDTSRYTDWQDKLIGNTSDVYDFNASLSGGNARTRFLTAVGYRREGVIYAGDFRAKKISGLLSLQHESDNRKFSIQASAGYQQNDNRLPIDDLTSQIRLAPNAPAIYGPDGKLNWEQSTWNNPMARTMQVITTDAETWRSSVNLVYRILPGLQLQFSGGYTSIQNQEHSARPLASQNPAQSPVAEATFGSKTLRTLIAEPQLMWSFKKGNAHHFSMLLGASYQQNKSTGIFQIGSGYNSDDLLGSLSAAAKVITSSESDIRYRYLAGFARLNYDWNRKYILTATLRRDGSSRYAPENRFATFGSFGAAWVFSGEKFLKNKIISFGKLRLSAGVTGNDQFGDYRYLNLYNTYAYPYLSSPVFNPSQLYSPDFGWERVTKWETGVDLSFGEEMATLTLNYFHNTTTDQLVNYALPATTGFTGVLKNLPARIRNTGWEIEGTVNMISRAAFKWSASMNLTIPKNRLLSFENFESSTYVNSFAIGRSLYIAKGYEFLGVDPATGLYSFRDYDGDGSISNPSDYKYYVDFAPQYYGGLQQNFTVGKWSMVMHWQFLAQKYARNYRLLFGKPGTNSNQPDWVWQRWQKPGDLTTIQRFTVSAAPPNQAYFNMQSSTGVYDNGSFIRLRNLQLMYRLWEHRVSQRNIDIFVQGQNLVTVSGYQGLDPETQTLLPPVRMITVGFKCNL